LQGAPGVTALAGTVSTIAGKALPNVTLTADCPKGSATAKSDGAGRFLISPLSAGHCELDINGETATDRGVTHGRFFAGIDLEASKTNVRLYIIWMTPIDKREENSISSPTTGETTITSSKLPGLKLILPKGTVLRDYEGNVVQQLGITPVPIHRPPFPLPAGVSVPIYFTIQPGGAFVEVGGSRYGNGKGARLIYPNTYRAPAGMRFDFWNYDPDGRGWYVYGKGTVSADRNSIVPDPDVVVHRFTGAMVAEPTTAPPEGSNPADQCDAQPTCGDPIDLGTGIMSFSRTDLSLPDVIPISLSRSYTQVTH
jgi:hypothetical protein